MIDLDFSQGKNCYLTLNNKPIGVITIKSFKDQQVTLGCDGNKGLQFLTAKNFFEKFIVKQSNT